MRPDAVPKCGAQTYWYENGIQRARWCDKPATTRVRAVGVISDYCDEHAAMTIEAGAEPVGTSEWHAGAHADSDSLFRHPGTLADCQECRPLSEATPENWSPNTAGPECDWCGACA